MKLPRFTLRELFLLVVIAAMGCGWWADRTVLSQSSRNAKQFEDIAHELSEAIDKMGGTAIYWYDEHGNDFGVQVVPPLPPIEISAADNEERDGYETNADAPLPQIEPLP